MLAQRRLNAGPSVAAPERHVHRVDPTSTATQSSVIKSQRSNPFAHSFFLPCPCGTAVKRRTSSVQAYFFVRGWSCICIEHFYYRNQVCILECVGFTCSWPRPWAIWATRPGVVVLVEQNHVRRKSFGQKYLHYLNDNGITGGNWLILCTELWTELLAHSFYQKTLSSLLNAGTLVQWLKLPAWKIGTGFKETNVSSPLNRKD